MMVTNTPLVSSNKLKTVKRLRYEKVEGALQAFDSFEVSFYPWIYDAKNIDVYISEIKKHLTPNLIRPKYWRPGNALFGHCYHATQALYYLLDEKLTPYSATDDNGQIHWWLQDGDIVVDPTAEQYDLQKIPPPYDKGKPTKWYGFKNRPHKKSLELVELVAKKQHLGLTNILI